MSMEKQQTRFTRKIDKLGACLSSLCALHCLVTPVLFGALSTLGLGFLLSERVELALFAVAVALAVMSAALGWRAHRRMAVLLAFIAAIATVLTGRAMGEDMMLGRVLVIGGAFAIAGCHLLSRYWSSSHRHGQRQAAS